MITQMTNQDPMKPMENGDFLGQIAQFGTVSGIQDLQGSFSTLADAMQSTQVLEASTMVGRSVMVSSDYGNLEPGGVVQGTIVLPHSASQVTVSVYDGNTGELVKQMGYGTQAPGELAYEWDGTDNNGNVAAPGVYELRAEANDGGETYALESWVGAYVDSVTFNGPGSAPVMNMTGIGRFDFSAIREVR